jgi:8-oxo-dGTP pyrophosphatase MutT (NUDIX family)
MADRSSAIILHQHHLLLIRRLKPGRDYYVFPGGHIEAGETAAAACIREVQEETGLQTAWMHPAFEFAADGKQAHYFFVRTQPGALVLSGPEVKKQSDNNRYILEWVPLARVGQIPLKPEAVRDALAQISAQEPGVLVNASDLPARLEQMKAILKIPATR